MVIMSTSFQVIGAAYEISMQNLDVAHEKNMCKCVYLMQLTGEGSNVERRTHWQFVHMNMYAEGPGPLAYSDINWWKIWDGVLNY